MAHKNERPTAANPTITPNRNDFSNTGGMGKRVGDGVPANSRVSGPYVVSASDESAVSIAVSETVVSIGAVSGPSTTGLCTDAQPDAINDTASTNKIGTLMRISPVQKKRIKFVL